MCQASFLDEGGHHRAWRADDPETTDGKVDLRSEIVDDGRFGQGDLDPVVGRYQRPGNDRSGELATALAVTSLAAQKSVLLLRLPHRDAVPRLLDNP